MLRPTPAKKRRASANLLGHRMNHLLGFGRGEAVELASVAVGDQNVDAGVHGAVDDRLQAVRGDAVLVVKRRDQNAGECP